MQGLSEQQKLIITVISVVVSCLTKLFFPSCSALPKPFVSCMLEASPALPLLPGNACLQCPPGVL